MFDATAEFEEAGSGAGSGGAGRAEKRECTGVVRDQRVAFGPSRSIQCRGTNVHSGSQRMKGLHLVSFEGKRKTVVRKESADTQEHEPYKVKGMNVHKQEDEERGPKKMVFEEEGPTVTQKQWRRLMSEKRSRGRLAVGLGFLGLEHKIIEIQGGKMMYATNLLEEAAAALSAGEECPNESPHKEELSWPCYEGEELNP